MNIPEGWPTEAMVNAGIVAYMNSHRKNAKEAMAFIFKDMLAAAPTPPAQGYISQVLPLPKQPEVTFTSSVREVSGPEEVAQLGAEAGARTKELLSSAQEDEPVAVVTSVRNNIGGGSISIRKDRSLDPGDMLYTRPQSDELRKAAKELCDYLDYPDVGNAITQELADKLRAALERK